MGSGVNIESERETTVAARSGWPTWLPWGVAGGGVLLHLWAMWDGFFHMDDFFYLADASRPFWDYVGQIYNGHLMPLGFAVVWASQAALPMSWALAVFVCTLLWVVFLAGVVLCMRAAFGNRPWTTVVVALIALSPLLTTVSSWYASALQVLPWGAALAWMLYFAIRDAQTPRLGFAIAGIAVYVVGLLFWQKTVLVLPVVLWLAWRYWPGSGRWGLPPLGRRWVLPVGSIVVTVPFMALYFASQPEQVLRSDPTLQQLIDSIRISLGEVWLPAYLGGPWAGFTPGLSPGTAAAWWAVLLVWQVVAFLVVVSLLRWRYAWNAWVLIAGYALLTVVLFAFGRINDFGLVLAYDPRYVEDLFIVGAIVLPFAFVSPRGSPLDGPRPLTWLPSRVPLLVGAGALVVLVNLLFMPSIAVGSSWHDSAAKRYVAQAKASFEANLDVPVLDRKVPPEVMAPLFLERANASYVLSGLRLPVRWNQAGTVVLALKDDGTLVEPVLATSSTSVPGLAGECGWAVKDGPTNIEMDTTVFEWIWVARMEYIASGSGVASASLQGSTTGFPLSEGLGEITFVLKGSGDTVVMTPPSDVGVCVTSLTLAQVDYGALP